MKKETLNKHIYSLGCIILLVSLAIGTVDETGTSDSSSTSGSSVDLNASISFTGTQFEITNNDTFDWTNVEFDLNSGTFTSGYTLSASRIESGQTYSVGTMRFTKSDGERFNPVTHSPQNITISCSTPRGRGFYYGTW